MGLVEARFFLCGCLEPVLFHHERCAIVHVMLSFGVA